MLSALHTNADSTSSRDTEQCLEECWSVRRQYPNPLEAMLAKVIGKSSSSVGSFLIGAPQNLSICSDVVDGNRLLAG